MPNQDVRRGRYAFTRCVAYNATVIGSHEKMRWIAGFCSIYILQSVLSAIDEEALKPLVIGH
jgi:hypothetical protein